MGRAALLALLLGAGAFAAPVPPENEVARRDRIYGAPADPNDGAKYELRGNNALRLTCPVWSWHPETEKSKFVREQLIRKKWVPTPDHAFRLWRGVTGNFTAVVRVSFHIPQADPPGYSVPRGAGLVAWAGDSDHIGVIRCESCGKPTWFGIVPLRETFNAILTRPKRYAASRGVFAEEAAAGFVRLRREGRTLTAGYSRDGKAWTDFLPDEVDWPDTIKLGVYANYLGAVPFDVGFDEYKVTVPVK